MDITIEGIEYTINLEKAKEAGLIVEKKKPIKRFIGQHYLLSGNCYVVSAFDDRLVGLTNVETGTRYNDAVKVGSLWDITLNEWRKISGSSTDHSNLEPIKVKFTY